MGGRQTAGGGGVCIRSHHSIWGISPGGLWETGQTTPSTNSEGAGDWPRAALGGEGTAHSGTMSTRMDRDPAVSAALMSGKC